MRFIATLCLLALGTGCTGRHAVYAGSATTVLGGAIVASTFRADTNCTPGHDCQLISSHAFDAEGRFIGGAMILLGALAIYSGLTMSDSEADAIQQQREGKPGKPAKSALVFDTHRM